MSHGEGPLCARVYDIPEHSAHRALPQPQPQSVVSPPSAPPHNEVPYYLVAYDTEEDDADGDIFLLHNRSATDQDARGKGMQEMDVPQLMTPMAGGVSRVLLRGGVGDYGDGSLNSYVDKG
jgi:hypothetical protein